MSNGKPLKKFKSPLVLIGMFFLINPYYKVFDILPDFIGYILIFYGISELAYLDERLSLASQKIIYLAVLSFGRFVAFWLSLGSHASTIMLLTFVFGAGEVILTIVFSGDFFGGLEYLLQRYDGYEALKKLPNSRFLTELFMIIKAVFCFLPETAELLLEKVEFSSIIDVEQISVYTDIASYKPYAVLLLMLITIIIGIWWYYDIFRYFSTMKSDTSFIGSVSAYYEESIVSDIYSPKIKPIRRSFVLFTIGIVFYFDFQISKITVLPDFIGTFLIFIALKEILPYHKRNNTKSCFIAILAQLIYSLCFRLFAETDISDLAEFSAENAIIMALASVFLGFASLLFISDAMETLDITEAAFDSKHNKKALRKSAVILYGIYLVINCAAVTIPVLYPWLLFPRMVLLCVFIGISVKQYYSVCEEYSFKLKDY